MDDIELQAEAAYVLHMEMSRERLAPLAQQGGLVDLIFSSVRHNTPFFTLPEETKQIWRDKVTANTLPDGVD